MATLDLTLHHDLRLGLFKMVTDNLSEGAPGSE